MSNEVHTISVYTTGVVAGTCPIVCIPAEGGDITVKHIYITGSGGGTPVGLKVTYMSNLGTPAFVGTVANFWAGTFVAGTLTMTAGCTYEASIKTARVPADNWLAVGNVSGAVMGTAYITINYVYGV